MGTVYVKDVEMLTDTDDESSLGVAEQTRCISGRSNTTPLYVEGLDCVSL